MASSTLVYKMNSVAQRLIRTARGIEDGTISLKIDHHQRTDLALATNDLVNSFIEPNDWIQAMGAHLSHFTALRLFVKWKAFEQVPTEAGAAISYAQLAAKLGGDVSLIRRITHILVANGTLKAVGGDSVAHTGLSKFFLSPYSQAAVELMFDIGVTSFINMPKYFDHFGLIEPSDRLQSVLAFGEGQLGSTVWEVIHQDEDRRKSFTTAMGAFEDFTLALGNYDLSWAAKEADRSTDRVLLVDVGGGKGHALIQIFKATPALPRHRCALEDLPEVIETAKRDQVELADVQMVAIDFHKDQPIKGALVYYIRSCLHNYSDDVAVTILQRLADAMASDSRLLIAENMTSDRPTPYITSLDLVLMALTGKKRSLENFHDILNRAGLRITQVCQVYGTSAVIECMLA